MPFLRKARQLLLIRMEHRSDLECSEVRVFAVAVVSCCLQQLRQQDGRSTLRSSLIGIDKRTG